MFVVNRIIRQKVIRFSLGYDWNSSVHSRNLGIQNLLSSCAYNQRLIRHNSWWHLGLDSGNGKGFTTNYRLHFMINSFYTKEDVYKKLNLKIFWMMLCYVCFQKLSDFRPKSQILKILANFQDWDHCWECFCCLTEADTLQFWYYILRETSTI